VLFAGYRGVVDMNGSNVAFWRRVFAMADSLPVRRFVLDLRENGGGNSFYNRQVVRGIVKRPALDRPGGLFVVIGPRTFSAAMNLALDLEKWTNATFVGEPTGNATMFFGDHQPVKLPNSGITVNVSSLPWHPYDARDRRDFVAPSMYVPMTAKAFAENRDPVMDAILARGSEPPFTARIEAAAERGDSAAVVRTIEEARGATANRYRRIDADVNTLGYALLNSHRIEPAITVFRANARVHPNSANAWDSLGEALAMAGRKDEAIASYRRAVAIDPEQQSARQALARLGAN
jgi:tetratricopeptide (TPR) repeat protein